MLTLQHTQCNPMVIMVSGDEGLICCFLCPSHRAAWVKHHISFGKLGYRDPCYPKLPWPFLHLCFLYSSQSLWSCCLVPAASSCQWTPLPGEGLCVPCVSPFCLCCRLECTSVANIGKINIYAKVHFLCHWPSWSLWDVQSCAMHREHVPGLWCSVPCTCTQPPSPLRLLQ